MWGPRLFTRQISRLKAADWRIARELFAPTMHALYIRAPDREIEERARLHLSLKILRLKASVNH